MPEGLLNFIGIKKLAELDLLSKSMQGLEQRVFCFSIVVIYGPTGS